MPIVPVGTRTPSAENASGRSRMKRAAARTAVNDANTDFAPGYGTVALRWSQRWAIAGGWRAELLARLDNAADRAYVGSVIVSEANGRFFEPGAPRNALLALRLVGP